MLNQNTVTLLPPPPPTPPPSRHPVQLMQTQHVSLMSFNMQPSHPSQSIPSIPLKQIPSLLESNIDLDNKSNIAPLVNNTFNNSSNNQVNFKILLQLSK